MTPPTQTISQTEEVDQNFWTTDQNESKSEKPVDHFAADEMEVLQNRLENEEYDSDEEAADLVFQDMELFCHAIGEPQLVECLKRHKVTLGQLLNFNEQDLMNCGIELVGERKKILSNTAQMHCEKWMPSSLHDLTAETMLSSPGIYIALNDINKHLEYIGVTFKYIRRRLQHQPNILELGKDYVGIAKVSSELDDLLKTSKATYTQLKALDYHVSKHLGDTNLKPANLIDENYIRTAKLKQRVLPVLLVTFTIVISVKILKLFK